LHTIIPIAQSATKAINKHSAMSENQIL